MGKTKLAKLEKRAWRLFESRFLPQAQSVESQQQVDHQLAAKLDSLPAEDSSRGKLRRVLRQATELWSNRSQLTKKDVALLAAALLYFISPLDVVPDVLPGVGYIDDVLVVSAIVGVILKGLTSVGAHGKEKLEEWIDHRTEIVFERIEDSATSGVQKAVAAVVISLWGTTTAAAISLSIATFLGRYPAEWLTYVIVSTVLVAACNLMTAAYYLREYRRLDGAWQKRLGTLVASKLKLPHLVAIGLPIVTLIGLGIARIVTTL